MKRMKIEEPKDRARIRRRNMIAKAMLEDRRRYGEKVVKDKSKDPVRFNKHDAMKRNYENDDD